MGSFNNVLEEYKDWYNRTIATGRDSFEKFHYHLQNQLRGLSLLGMNILEVGCGKGAVSLYMALFSGAKHVTALDEAIGEGAPAGITQELKDAINLFKVKNLSVEESDVMKNSFKDNYFDVIIANNALHHVVDLGLVYQDPQVREDYMRLFAELKRMLVPTGILIILEYSRESFWRWSPVKLKWKEIDWELHPTRAEWLSVIRQAGFTIRAFDYTVPYSLRFIKPIIMNPIIQFMLYPSFVITAHR